MGPQTEPSLFQSSILEGFDDNSHRVRLLVLCCHLFLLKIQKVRFPSSPAASPHQQSCHNRDTNAQSLPYLFHVIILLASGLPRRQKRTQCTQVTDQRQIDEEQAAEKSRQLSRRLRFRSRLSVQDSDLRSTSTLISTSAEPVSFRRAAPDSC